MSQIDELFGKALNMADAAGKKTGELVEVSRLKLSLAKLNTSIDEEYKNLGKIVYEMRSIEKADTHAVDEICEKIVVLREKIKQLEQQIAILTNTNLCECCKNSNPSCALFCSKCGAKIDKTANADTKPEEEEDGFTQRYINDEPNNED